MNSVINHILISMPHVQDPLFGNSVVYMCEHDKQGAMGLIVNKPLKDPNLKATFEQIYEFSDEIIESVSQIYFGGPVLMERGILLHSSNFQSENSIRISDQFFISSHKKTLDDMKKYDEKHFGRLFIGHAGWSPGQLEREIEKGDWLVQETSPDFIFKIPVGQMWDMAIQSFGIDIAGFSNFGGRA